MPNILMRMRFLYKRPLISLPHVLGLYFVPSHLQHVTASAKFFNAVTLYEGNNRSSMFSYFVLFAILFQHFDEWQTQNPTLSHHYCALNKSLLYLSGTLKFTENKIALLFVLVPVTKLHHLYLHFDASWSMHSDGKWLFSSRGKWLFTLLNVEASL